MSLLQLYQNYLNQALPDISGIFRSTPAQAVEETTEETVTQPVGVTPQLLQLTGGGDGFSVYNPDPTRTRTIKDYRFPFKFTGEIYYKYMWDINPYEIDNVRTRYYAENNAIGYAYGIDMNVYGQFVKGIESFFKLGLMSTKEDIQGDSYTEYYLLSNADILVMSSSFFGETAAELGRIRNVYYFDGCFPVDLTGA